MLLDQANENQLNEIISSFNLWYDRSQIIDKNRSIFLASKDQKSLEDVRQEIAESWLRSKSKGVIPENELSRKMLLDCSSFDKVLKENKKLLEIAAPILSEAQAIYQSVNTFGIGLFDRNAVLLYVRNYPLKEIKPGMDFSEEKVGTSAVSMSLSQNKPVYLLGSEIYNDYLRNTKLIVSIPIHDPDGRIVSFFVAPYFRSFTYTAEEKQLLTLLVSWQFSTAQRLEDAILHHSGKIYVPGASYDRNSRDSKKSTLEAVYSFDDIMGCSDSIHRTKQIAEKIAHSLGNVLLLGESGTGKELFAHSIHNESCPSKPFVAINCAAIPKNLIESELFGYEGGSFTGAERKGRMGKLEMANEGTLFLDEIGDMPLELQPVFLRVLEDKKVMRVGGRNYIPTTFRIISATNMDLYEKVKRKEFREDLYFRLAALKLHIPPLRDRGNDIIDLARAFIQETCSQIKRPVPEMDPEVLQCFRKYPWTGNIRELKNCILWAVTLADDKISIQHIPEEITGYVQHHSHKNFTEIRQNLINDWEYDTIQKTLSECNDNITKAAKSLGISRPTLYRKLETYGHEKMLLDK